MNGKFLQGKLLFRLAMFVISLVATAERRRTVMLMYMKYLSEIFRYKKAFRVTGIGAVLVRPHNSWRLPIRLECCDSRFEA
jgi:hypothetical protein